MPPQTQGYRMKDCILRILCFERRALCYPTHSGAYDEEYSQGKLSRNTKMAPILIQKGQPTALAWLVDFNIQKELWFADSRMFPPDFGRRLGGQKMCIWKGEAGSCKSDAKSVMETLACWWCQECRMPTSESHNPKESTCRIQKVRPEWQGCTAYPFEVHILPKPGQVLNIWP